MHSFIPFYSTLLLDRIQDARCAYPDLSVNCIMQKEERKCRKNLQNSLVHNL